MGDDYHKPGLYRWKRQEDPRVYSRSQNVKSNNDIQDWIQKVEQASNNAARQVFGSNHSSGSGRGKAAAKATREIMQDDEQAYSEAQELLSQWMDEKVNLHGNPDLDIDCNYDDDSWQRHELQSDVKREWDNLLANNYEEYGLPVSSRSTRKHSSDIYNMDEDDAVAMVMKNMRDKQVVKKEFKKDLGLDKWGKQKDPRSKMELRQKQVKENREKREAELKKRREEFQNKKEAVSRAKQVVLKEERLKELGARREEMNVRKEMTKIRKEMQDERRKVEEKKAKEKQSKEETMLSARVKVAWDVEAEEEETIEEERRKEEKQRMLVQRLRELEAKEAANNLKVLHRHFSAWYNVVLDKQLKMGKARAIFDWKLLLRAWNAWRSFIRGRRMERETKQYEVEVINTQRNKQKAENHNRLALLRKYFVTWQVWSQSQAERRDLEQAQSNTRNKMMSLLEAAASGKLWNPGDSESTKSTPRNQERKSRQDKQKPSTADKINALFEQTRKLPQPTDSMSTDRSDTSSMSSASHHKVPQSRLPTEPWQVTRKHLQLSPQEMEELGGEPTCSPEEMNAKVLKKYGKQAWHKPEVSTYEHRHAAQKKILDEQKRQIREQQRLIEDLQFKSTHVELQKQLVEQKLVLQNISEQVSSNIPDDPDLVSENSYNNKNVNINQKQKTGSKQIAVKNSEKSFKVPLHTGAKSSSSRNPKEERGAGFDTSRTSATTNRSGRPSSARTDVSRPMSYTSTTSEKSKYLQVLKNMDDRAAERTRLKAEREGKRRKAEEERLMELEAVEEVRRREEEEEKRSKVEAFRERKRQEKQREIERQLREEKLKQQTEMADQHYERSILKYRGLVPMKKLVAMAKENQQQAEQHHQRVLLKKVLLSWHHYVKDQWREKEALADEMHNFLSVKHCFQNWRVYKHHMIIQEHKAVKHYQALVKTKVLQRWRDYANEEKVASWEKDRRAREHYRKLLLSRHFNAWRTLPEEIEREKERERRRAELRQKVASILPDFDVSSSVEQSADFTL